MRQTNKKTALLMAFFLIAAGAAFSISVTAHTGATGIVKERMELMGKIGKAQKSLSEMFSGKVPYDAGKVRAAAATIKKHAGGAMVKLFPAGSIKKPSEALPAIWENWTEFKQLSDELAIFASALAENADNKTDGAAEKKNSTMMGGNTMMGTVKKTIDQELSALKNMPPLASFERLAQNCSGCHIKFRLKKK